MRRTPSHLISSFSATIIGSSERARRRRRRHHTKPSKSLHKIIGLVSPLQNLIISAGATKFHFLWPEMAVHESRLTTFVNPPTHQAARRLTPICRPSHLDKPSKLTELCEYANKLAILTTLVWFYKTQLFK
ncbi:hypothetical protein PHAVU_007G089000 [Phaseolus vulgaris]|uniref:Uncharacterized protein n=1 Tax=Phaseolus vulgaris TaxID=3885 RepID=V7BDK9_PHAVU|nr:hypothetical protein PHAVU_007G089000g [Phaseolus vulgaris]ESW15635.1 hypothetical protein PHAVU_007G089000g [Phaseolus vulgaris]